MLSVGGPRRLPPLQSRGLAPGGAADSPGVSLSPLSAAGQLVHLPAVTGTPERAAVDNDAIDVTATATPATAALEVEAAGHGGGDGDGDGDGDAVAALFSPHLPGAGDLMSPAGHETSPLLGKSDEGRRGTGV
jgi:hypothetical protein